MGYLNSRGEEIPPARGLAKPMVKVVRFYQKHVSGFKMVSTCRFEPTCSAYALEALSKHGAFKGTAMAIVRVCKCGPWHPGGFDPVPDTNNN
ncbi:membrane protein insertion efficiency factor YidD [Corynebacterium yonathiae]